MGGRPDELGSGCVLDPAPKGHDDVARFSSCFRIMSADATTAISDRARPYFPAVWFGVAALVFLVVLFGVFGESKDWQNYSDMFDILRVVGLGEDEENSDRIETGFKALALGLIGMSLSNVAVYGAIAAISVFIKCAAINAGAKSGTAYFFAIVFYLFTFAPLHELTQLRAALAIAMLFVGYALLVSERRFLGILITLSAIAFHISAAFMFSLFIFVFFFERQFIKLTRARAILFGAAVFSASIVLIAVLIAYFEEELPIIAAYQEFGFGDVPTNPIAPHILLNLSMVLTGLMLWDRLSQGMRYVLFFQLTGIGVFYATLEFQVVASRIYDLTQTFWVFYIAEGADSDDPSVSFTTRAFVLAAVAAFSYIYFFSSSFFQ